ncbi:MAG: hypothetical protein COV46_03055 [Deltaproteobacteria bacterium CG11_big_fil_rev_8_21_14_0_20_49_13]|nr:MAG: hypothetical protein COV46_03055 [Deltaproteobacteria bacterium CG11_big_fil_rev_8_21_14_0_20_49_13]
MGIICDVGNWFADLVGYTLTACQPEPELEARALSLEGVVKIPAGTFKMGSEDVHEVTLSHSFYIDQHGVTNEAYTRITGKEPSPKDFDGPNQPAVKVNWNDANKYCKAIGKRLPTEAEWEYVARGESHTQEYPTLDGSKPTTGQARYNSNNTADVCSYMGNYVLWGGKPVCDLAGNTWEWVNDWYGSYPIDHVVDPTGPKDGTLKVLRGGSWSVNYSVFLRAANRDNNHPDYSRLSVGFRCASSEDSSR